MTIGEARPHCRRSGNTLAAIFLLVLIALSPVHVRAQAPQAWIGSWYSETREDKLIDGKKYDIRRELLVNRGDGTKINTFRYYNGGQVVTEAVVTYVWGVDNNVFWTVCRTVLMNGEATACSVRFEYDVISTTVREIRYKSRQTAIEYSILRVADEFKLP